MTDGMRGWLRRLWSQDRDKKIRWFILLGLFGIALIALSEWLPRPRTATSQPSATVTVETTAIEQALEARITALIRQVAGVGDCRVMVTVESGNRYVYAAEQSYSAGTDTYTGSEKILTVQTDTGPVGLLVTEIQPTVKGVAVVCTGGDDEMVCEQVRQLLCAALNISSGRVYVAKQQ